jgi:predicted DNA-binding antitoxin AbrB/MazE fold protein
MIRTTEAIFADGVLTPLEPLNLREQQRVRITVQEVEAQPADRAAAIQRMVEGFEKLRLRTNGRMPTREELHERD